MIRRLLSKLLRRRPAPKPLTCEAIDQMFPDDTVVPAGSVYTNRYSRHLFFLRFILGLRLTEAYQVAVRCQDEALPLAAMKHLAEHWGDEDYDGPTAHQVAGLEPMTA